MCGRAFASTVRSDIVLGINCVFHECCASLIVDGKLVAAAEEERFNRIKHSKNPTPENGGQLPKNAIKYCLDQHGIKAEDVPLIGLSFEPDDFLEKNMNYEPGYEMAFFSKDYGIPTLFRSASSAEDNLRELGFVGEVRFLPHHDCHAASAFYTSGLDTAAVLVIDGIGEFESTTAYYADRGVMTPLDCLSHGFPDSLGFLWEKLCVYLGFSRYDASKVMGLASYGDPSIFQTKMNSLVQIHDDGSFKVDDTISLFESVGDRMDRLEALFGHPARTNPVREPSDADVRWALDLAATLQQCTETIFIRMAKTLKAKTNADYLCFAGGVALNCAANAKMLETGLFKDIFVFPAANDAGTAVGAAYLARASALQQAGGVPLTPLAMHHPYLGPSFSNDYIFKAVSSANLSFTRFELDALPREAAKLVAAGDIVAWFQGGMELGPRALGNRSILGDPRNNDIREILNVKIKHRELFRPFCPSVLEEEAHNWFELPEGPIPHIAKHMLGAFPVKREKSLMIPSVVHVDMTCRIQAVSKDTNPLYHKLISEFNELTGIPMLLNTSFNDQEPINCTPEDAIETVLRTGIDWLIMGEYMIKLEGVSSRRG